jgi:hypothetical protein
MVSVSAFVELRSATLQRAVEVRFLVLNFLMRSNGGQHS